MSPSWTFTAVRLDQRHGELPIRKLIEHTYYWTRDRMEMAAFNDDHADELLTSRKEIEVAEAQYKSTGRNGRRARGSRARGGRSATVRRGDTLGAIARRNGTTVANLRRLNGIRGNNIRAGQKIRVR